MQIENYSFGVLQNSVENVDTFNDTLQYRKKQVKQQQRVERRNAVEQV